MNDDTIMAWGFVISIVTAFCAGALLGWGVMSDIGRQQIEKCRKEHNVYVCELMPVANPIWIKPNAENT